MNCDFDRIKNLIIIAIVCLGAAIALAALWVSAWSLFPAAVLVGSVSYYFIPAIKQAILDYVACRGPSGKCNIKNIGIDTLGQIAAALSATSFVAAGLLELTALAFISSWILSAIGVTLQVAVSYLVKQGIIACSIAAAALFGVLTNAYSYKSCMDSQKSGLGSQTGGVTIQGRRLPS
jgi:hypothetical protein